MTAIIHLQKYAEVLERFLPKKLPMKEKARILLINLFSIFLTPILLLYTFYLHGKVDSSIEIALYVLMFFCVLPVFFNLLKKYELAKLWYTFQAPILVLSYCAILGGQLGIQYFFIILFGYPFIFFKPEHKVRTLVFVVYNSLCLLLFELGYIPLRSNVFTETTASQVQLIILFILIAFCSLIVFSFHIMITKNAEDLEAKTNELEKAYGMKQDFLATMSHELRTPLNAVVTITSLLDESPNRKDKEKLISLLKFSSNNLLSIINDILDFSKLEVSKIKLDNRPHDLGKLLQEIRDTYKNLADEKGLDLKLKIAKDVEKIYKVDDVKLGQILGNLLGNAIKFTDLGRISLTVTKVMEAGLKDILRFEVSDTGSGIAETDMEEIFESFSQSKSVTTRRKDGTGLGLAIVKRLLNLYDAEIKVDSEVGKGSNFHFDISLKRGGQIVALENQKYAALANKKILIVEDNAINLMVAEKLLSSWGITSIKATNGEEAIKKCNEEEYDLILMDLHMPVMDGFNAAKLIRNVENINIYTPIFALSADVTGESNRTYNKYFDGFLTKPIQKEKLHKLLVDQLS